MFPSTHYIVYMPRTCCAQASRAVDASTRLMVALSCLPDRLSNTMISGDREYTDVRAEAEVRHCAGCRHVVVHAARVSPWFQASDVVSQYVVSVHYSYLLVGSRPSDHYFHSVCWFVCLFVCAEFFSAVFDPISIKLGHMLYVWVYLCPLEYRGWVTPKNLYF